MSLVVGKQRREQFANPSRTEISLDVDEISANRSSMAILEDLGAGRVGDAVNGIRSVAFASDPWGWAISRSSSGGELSRRHASTCPDVVAFEVRR